MFDTSQTYQEIGPFGKLFGPSRDASQTYERMHHLLDKFFTIVIDRRYVAQNSRRKDSPSDLHKYSHEREGHQL
jgi:hypothetical protein